jgi:predicted nucleic acid-binding protein
MSRAVLADTGPLYAANDEGDAHHQRALRELKQLARERREVLIAYSLLLFRLGRNAASGWLIEVSDVSLVNPTPEDYGRAFATVRALNDQRITLVDATVAALAARLQVEVWTYDHHFDVMHAGAWR